MDDDTKKKLWIGLPAMGVLAAAAVIGKKAVDKRREAKVRNPAERPVTLPNRDDPDGE